MYATTRGEVGYNMVSGSVKGCDVVDNRHLATLDKNFCIQFSIRVSILDYNKNICLNLTKH